MKTKSMIRKGGALTLWLLLMLYPPLSAQSPATGEWSGMFMISFRTVIHLDCDDPGLYSGRIMMYDGNELIQDDALSKITLEGNRLSFHIQAKDTDFRGKFNESMTEFTGNFIFPDQSEHPLTVTRKDEQTGMDSQ